MKKRFLILSVIVLHFCGMAQTLPPPTTVSPNVASLGKFGEIPVSLFTGVPDISIPIHTLRYGNIEVPIALRYHPGSVKPAQHPGWVGLGWNLQSFGAITRTVRGQEDDPYGNAGTSTGPPNAYISNAYYPPINTNRPSGAEYANASNWDWPSILFQDCLTRSDTGIMDSDVQADEFSFNFLGYSGTFYYSGPALGWQVKSDQNIKVALTGFLSSTTVAAAIQGFKQFGVAGMPSVAILDTNQPNVFSGFTLTVPDGTKYTFGSTGGSEGIEFSSDYVSGRHKFTANTWLLTKIVDANNNKVDFTYQRTWPTVSFFFSQEIQDVSGSTTSMGIFNLPGCSGSSWNYQSIDANTHFGILQWPMYLSTIKSPNETIRFDISDDTTRTSCLRYTDDQLKQITWGGGNNMENFFNHYKQNNPLRYSVNHLKWEQLDDIVISSSSGNIYRKYHFEYSNSASQRLTLNKLYEQDNSGSTIGQYQFLYNDVAYLSRSLYDGNFTDHWGYFNGNNIHQAPFGNLFSYKQTNPTVVTKGLLTQITYPTGGYTKFAWEAHDYSQVVSTDRQSLISPIPGLTYVGGSRIKEISSYDKTGVLSLNKKYYYKRGYTAGGNTSTLSSSGVLNGVPLYAFSITNRKNYAPPNQNVFGTAYFNIGWASFNSLTTYSNNGAGSYIGYDEVAEVNADGSYTRNFFTSYGPDLNNIPHWDIKPTGYIGWSETDDAYFPMSSREEERGKPIGIYHYAKNNLPVQKTDYTYRFDPERFNNYIKLIDYNRSYSACSSSGAYLIHFISARKVFTYSYYPVTKKVTSYDLQGNATVVASENYTYDLNNMLTQKTMVNSRNESLVSKYTYTTQAAPTDPVSQQMVNAHILTPIIKTSVTNGANPVGLTSATYYSPYPSIFVPLIVQLAKGNNSVETRQQFYKYDIHGNVQEEAKAGDTDHTVYLWGYNSQYLVAVITNTTYTAVQTVMATNSLSQSQLDNPSTSDAAMRTLLNKLRTGLPNSQVSTYTYAPLMGMTSATDAKGETSYYEYDSFGRLMSIKNNDGNILKNYKYHYQPQ